MNSTFFNNLKSYRRFARGYRRFLGPPISPEEVRSAVLKRLEEREEAFLRLLERGIFGSPSSPYLPLFNLARAGLEDVRDMVRRRGLESTLLALRAAGVFVSFEEFKGRRPMVRQGKVIPVAARDFDNPHSLSFYEGESSGTTGPGTRVTHDLDSLAVQAQFALLIRQAHGLLGLPAAVWLGVLPDGSGLANVLMSIRLGDVPQKWFAPNLHRKRKLSWKNRLITRYIVYMGRRYGVPVPRPEPVSLEQAAVVARWASSTVRDHGPCLIVTHISKALRVCLAARNEGLDLTGATFMGGGEPTTPAKVRGIKEAGARWIPTYPFSETGLVGLGCANPADESDLHFLRDSLALIPYRRPVPGSEMTVEAFNFTTLLPTAPKLMLNVEIDDYGIIEQRSCGCPLESLGYTDHLRRIQSFRKLTGEGCTLVGSEMIRILEEILPARFGGSPLDYQILEEEDGRGFTRLSLLVSPELPIDDEGAIIEAVMDELGRRGPAEGEAREIWEQAGTMRVRRARPIWTERGKLMPIQLSKEKRGKI